MPAGLIALSDDDVRAGVQGLARVVEVLHLGGVRNAGGADAVGERPHVTERQHDGGRLPRQGLIEQLGLSGKAPGDEPAPDLGPIGSVEFALQPFGVAVAAADEAQAAGRRHRRREPAPGNHGHRGEQDWVLDPEELRQTSGQCHGYLS